MPQRLELRSEVVSLLKPLCGALRDGASALRAASARRVSASRGDYARSSQATRLTQMTGRLLVTVVALAIAAAAAGSAEAQSATATPGSGGIDTVVAYTQARLHLRAAPGTTSPAVVLLPRGARVSVDWCLRKWCAVGYGTQVGYAAERYLAAAPPVVRVLDRPSVVQEGGPGYRNVRGEWVPSPRRSVDGRPPTGASARCRDGTYSFSRSRRGTCSWHGGVARWL
jgi:hypothetical protein